MFFSTPVMAEEPIVGAFGLKLGDVWDGEAIATRDFDTYFQHRFIPEFPHDLFDTYTVLVTPVSNLIFGIMGIKKGDCEQYQDLKKALIKKYGAGIMANEIGHLWRQSKRKLEHPNDEMHVRVIAIKCDAVGFRIFYHDYNIDDSIADELLPDTSNL